MTMRYGVSYQPISGTIDAGAVRATPSGIDVFIMSSDVTDHALIASALWLLVHDDGTPHRITDRHGTTYEMTSRVVKTEEVLHP